MTTPAVPRDGLRVDDLEPALAARVLQTVSCRDCEALPKVEGAGQVVERDGRRVQIMHNGVLVEEGGYFGDWMARIISALGGHHEPQEELVFDAAVRRLAADPGPAEPVMIEVGAYWAYYSLWFCQELAAARAYGIEPDPGFLDVGLRNVALNGLEDRIHLAPGVVGEEPGTLLDFVAESDGTTRAVLQYDLASLMEGHGLDHVDLVLSDIQGWELVFLERALPLLRQGKVRFLVVSTHHHTISGDALTHQKVRALLEGAGAHVLADHTVGESASGDGLIAVSFDARDADLTVPVSHVRYRDSLFGELEYDVAAAQAEAATLRRDLEATRQALAESERRFERARQRAKRLRRELVAATRPADPPEGSRGRLASLSSKALSRVRGDR